ncbi:MAG: sigma-70 family RNA polymerase sigma factor [Culturomica sp.]|jgi:RNA polymerase sigma factor (sigma-70 family)|nr:sigma-70 family RNA polymerase sigma factor [Culturomica sp.]
MNYSDRELIDGILANDEEIIRIFFFECCAPMFRYIVAKVFRNREEQDELINELYIYLHENDWYKLRQFNFRSKLTTYVSVVAMRFFMRMRNRMIEFDLDSALYLQNEDTTYDIQDAKMDLNTILSSLPNERYRKVIYALYIEDVEPEMLAQEFDITIANLYNIKRRALTQLINHGKTIEKLTKIEQYGK